jgi:hypothetical protein
MLLEEKENMEETAAKEIREQQTGSLAKGEIGGRCKHEEIYSR